MTGTAAGVEKAREALEAAREGLAQFRGLAALKHIETALAALNGEAEEEWTAEVGDAIRGGKTWAVRDKDGRWWAECPHEEAARRIASDHNRLPKLERAAGCAERYLDASDVRSDEHTRILAALRSALAGEEGK